MFPIYVFLDKTSTWGWITSTCLWPYLTFGKGTHRFTFPWGKYDQPSNLIKSLHWDHWDRPSENFLYPNRAKLRISAGNNMKLCDTCLTWRSNTWLHLYPYSVECSLGLLPGCPTVTPMSSPPFCSKQLPFCRAIWTVFGLGQLRHVHWVGWPNTKFRHTSTMKPW